MSKLTSNTWLNTLYTATVPGGGAAQVNLAVWETNTKDPSNISREVVSPEVETFPVRIPTPTMCVDSKPKTSKPSTEPGIPPSI